MILADQIEWFVPLLLFLHFQFLFHHCISSSSSTIISSSCFSCPSFSFFHFSSRTFISLNQSTSKRLGRVRGSHDASYSTIKRLNLCHQFYIDPNLHDLFLAVVHQTKNNRTDRKFAVWAFRGIFKFILEIINCRLKWNLFLYQPCLFMNCFTSYVCKSRVNDMYFDRVARWTTTVVTTAFVYGFWDVFYAILF